MDNPFSEGIAGLLTDLIAKGFVAPFHVAVVGCNGASLLATFHDTSEGFDVEFHYEAADDLKLPINIMASDTRGEAVHAVIDTQSLRLAH